jgi:hypothetical protein
MDDEQSGGFLVPGYWADAMQKSSDPAVVRSLISDYERRHFPRISRMQRIRQAIAWRVLAVARWIEPSVCGCYDD